MTPAAQPAAQRRPPDRHDYNQEDPVTTPDIQRGDRIHIAVSNPSGWTQYEARKIADEITSMYSAIGVEVIGFTCTTGDWPVAIVARIPADQPTDPEAMREAASRLLTEANEAEAGR